MDSKKSVKAVLAALAVTSLFTSVNTIYAADQSQDKAKDKNAENAVKGQANQDSLYNMVALLDGTKTKSTATTTAPVATTAANVKADAPKEDTTTDTQNSVTNNQGFYVQQDTTNGGTADVYNSLTKDGLWVGGTSDDTGFHVDNAGTVKTTGDITADGTVQAGDFVMPVTYENPYGFEKSGTFSFKKAGLVPGETNTDGKQNLALGAGAQVGVDEADDTKQTATHNVAIGPNANINAGVQSSVAIGVNSSVNTLLNKDITKATAVGMASSISSSNSAAYGAGSTVGFKAEGGTALGTDANVDGNNSTSVGYGVDIRSDNSVAIGGNDSHVGNKQYSKTKVFDNAAQSTVVGVSASSQSTEGTAVGFKSSARAEKSLALGSHSDVSFGGKNSVALGSDSVADEENVVSVGNKDNDLQRKIVNVADGTVDKGSTDAVTGGQLYDVSQKVTDLDSLAVKYNDATKGSVTFSNTTLKNVNDVELNVKGGSRGLVSSGITPGTVYAKADGWDEGAAADTASLAIGGGLQNSQTTSATVRGKNSIAIGSGASVDATAQELDAPLNGFDNANGVAIGVGANVSGIQGTAVGYGATVKENQGTAFGNQSAANGNKATAIGFSAVADADNSTVLGQGASVGTGADNSVALGAGSVVFNSDLKGTDKNGVVSVGSGNAERRIIHVADGVDAHDAVNKGQLDTLSSNAVQYDKNEDGTTNYGSITFKGAGEDVGTNLKNIGTISAANGWFYLDNTGKVSTYDVAISDGGDYNSFTDAGLVAGKVTVPASYNTFDNLVIGSGAKIDNMDTENGFAKQNTAVGNKAQILPGFNWEEDSEGKVTVKRANSVSGSSAFGAGAQVTGNNSSAYGSSASVTNDLGVAIGYNAKAGKSSSKADDGKATAVGAEANAGGNSSTALGYYAQATVDKGTAVGANTSLGYGTEGSVALGANSKVDSADLLKDKDGKVIETNGVVSVGDSNYGTNSKYSFQRRIINVADGVNKFDAVNKGQLDAVDTKVTGLSDSAVQYDKTTDGKVDTNSVTFKGEKGTTLNNVKDIVFTDEVPLYPGADPDDTKLVNLSFRDAGLLPGTIDTEGAEKSTAIGKDSSISGSSTGSTVVGYGANVYGGVQDATAIGNGASIGNNSILNGSVALGAGSTVSNAGSGLPDIINSDKHGVVSVGSSDPIPGRGFTRRIINVTDGRLLANSHDAVTGGQLFTTNENLNKTNETLGKTNEKLDKTYYIADANAKLIGNGVLENHAFNLTDGINLNTRAIEKETKARTDADQVFTDKFKAYEDAGIKAGHAEGATDDTWSLALGEESSIIDGDGNARSHSVAIGYGANVQQDNSTAVGTNANNNGNFSTSVGEEATGAGDYATALGGLAYAYKNGTAVGTRALAEENSVALGADSIAKDKGVVSVGHAKGDEYTADDGSTLNYESDLNRKIVNVADGTDDHDVATYGQVKGAIALVGRNDNDDTNLAVGKDSFTTAYYDQEAKKYVNANNTAIGVKAQISVTSSQNSTAIGNNASIQNGTNATAIGQNASVHTDNGTAIGQGATVAFEAGNQGSVALGQNSAVRWGDHKDADTNGVVSVGKTDSFQRRIINVANGVVEKGSHDAVTGGQLYATNQTIGDISKFEKAGLTDRDDEPFDNVTDAIVDNKKNIDYFWKKFNNFGSAGVVVEEGYSAGANSLQLGNKTHADTIESIAIGPFASTYGDAKDKEKNKNSTSIGVHSYTNGHDSTALGHNANAWGDNTTVIGADGQSTGSAENPVENNTVIGAQAKTQGVSNATALGQSATVTVQNAVALGAGSIAAEANTVSVGSAENKRKITNVADGVNDTDAATVGQIKAADKVLTDKFTTYVNAGIIAGKANAKNSIAIGNNTNAAYQGVALGANANTSAVNGVAIGADSEASGDNSTALGYASKATGSQATALGQHAQAFAEQSVALGEDSIATEKGTVSVGNGSWLSRRITNVAAGTSDHDATIVGQFKGANGSNFLNAVDKFNWKSVADNSDRLTKLVSDVASGKFDNLLKASSTFDVSKISALSLAADVPTSILKEQTNTTAAGTTDGRNPETGSGSTGGWSSDKDGVSTTGKVTTGDLVVNGNATLNEGLTVNGATTLKDTTVKGNLTIGEGKDAINVGESIKKNSDSIKANQAAIEQNQKDIASLGTSVQNLGDEVDSVGAISAALAGLHPLDYGGKDSKFQISAALGSYDGTRAAALGGFYNANRDTLISFGVSTNLNGDARKTAANIGATFRVGQGNSKEIPDDVASLRDEVVSLKAENATYKDRMDEMEKQLQELLKASKKN